MKAVSHAAEKHFSKRRRVIEQTLAERGESWCSRCRANRASNPPEEGARVTSEAPSQVARGSKGVWAWNREAIRRSYTHTRPFTFETGGGQTLGPIPRASASRCSPAPRAPLRLVRQVRPRVFRKALAGFISWTAQMHRWDAASVRELLASLSGRADQVFRALSYAPWSCSHSGANGPGSNDDSELLSPHVTKSVGSPPPRRPEACSGGSRKAELPIQHAQGETRRNASWSTRHTPRRKKALLDFCTWPTGRRRRLSSLATRRQERARFRSLTHSLNVAQRTRPKVGAEPVWLADARSAPGGGPC